MLIDAMPLVTYERIGTDMHKCQFKAIKPGRQLISGKTDFPFKKVIF
jgi:hypothetical protein